MVFTSLLRKPGLIVFDLDCTLWPFDCDDYFDSRLYERGGSVYDGSDTPIKPYPHSEIVLSRIKQEPGVKLGVASMTSSPRVGHKLIKLFGWDRYFDYVEIYPVSKTKHFKTLASPSTKCSSSTISHSISVKWAVSVFILCLFAMVSTSPSCDLPSRSLPLFAPASSREELILTFRRPVSQFLHFVTLCYLLLDPYVACSFCIEMVGFLNTSELGPPRVLVVVVLLGRRVRCTSLAKLAWATPVARRSEPEVLKL
ncbi:Magnesium-dependent phosphatase 1 [Taenia crassiceps]|uniref:Magnesium-dependent phosphatase 1 n=1 Tax=Taenia crassiceps TaxID=6207 RepID=A0ABR4Q6F6_9CEST